jgi:hypothetical protein
LEEQQAGKRVAASAGWLVGKMVWSWAEARAEKMVENLVGKSVSMTAG